MKKSLLAFLSVGALIFAAVISFGVAKPLLTHALAPVDREPYTPSLRADSYRVNANGVETDTLYVEGGTPNRPVTLFYTGPNGEGGSERMCVGNVNGDCSKVYGPWNASSAGTWSFYVNMPGGESSNTIQINFIAPPTAQLAVANNNFNLTQGVVESESTSVENISSASGFSFSLSYAKDSWIVIDSAPASLNGGGSGTLTFHVDNSQVPARSSAPQTIIGAITVTADGSGSGTTVTGSPQTITVNYTIPPAAPVIIAPPAPKVVINIISDPYTVRGGKAPYTWYVDGVSAGTGSTFQYTFTTLGNHTVSVTDANGNSDSASVTVVANPPSSCAATGTWDTKTTFCVGDTTTWSVTSNPSGFASYAHNISNRPTTANPYDTNSANQKNEAPYFDVNFTNYSASYVYKSWDVGFYSQQKFFLQQGGVDICSTSNSWSNITVYPSSDVHCGGIVQPPGYPKLVVSPSSATAVQQGSPVSFNAAYVTLDSQNKEVNTDVTANANWSSSNSSVASATSIPGSFNPNNPGTAAISATYNDISSSASLTVTPVSSADFSLAADPLARTVSFGGKATYTITVTKIGTLQNPVNLHVAGLPAGASASFAPSSSVTPTVNATLTVDSGSASPGTFALQVIGTSGTLTHDIWLSFTIGACSGVCGNLSPVANANGPYTGRMGTAVSFSSAGSFDLDGSISGYVWNFGDGGTSAASNPTHTYAATGNYTVKLTVTDNLSATGSNSTTAKISGDNGGGYNCINNSCVFNQQGGQYGNLSACAAAGCGDNDALKISPLNQSALVNQGVNFTASGGNGPYSWSAPGGNPASGSGPSFSTSYNSPGPKTVTVTSEGVSVSGSVGVSSPGPVSCTFTANPRTIIPPQRSTLSWNCSGAISCEISNVGSVNRVSGNVQVNPTSTTSYVLTCNGAGGQSFSLSALVNASSSIIEVAP